MFTKLASEARFPEGFKSDSRDDLFKPATATPIIDQADTDASQPAPTPVADQVLKVEPKSDAQEAEEQAKSDAL